MVRKKEKDLVRANTFPNSPIHKSEKLDFDGKIKITYNKKVLYVIIIVFIALVAVLIWLGYNKNTPECSNDSDCVKQRTSCCACTMGGEETCMSKANASIWRENIAKNCNGVFCTAVYNCKETSCLCRQGKCAIS